MSKHTPGLAADGWTLIYRDAKQAAYAHEAIRQGADEDCVGPGDEGWYWYNEGTGQVGDRLNLDLVAAAPELLTAVRNLLVLAEDAMSEANRRGCSYVIGEELAQGEAAIAKAEGRS